MQLAHRSILTQRLGISPAFVCSEAIMPKMTDGQPCGADKSNTQWRRRPETSELDRCPGWPPRCPPDCRLPQRLLLNNRCQNLRHIFSSPTLRNLPVFSPSLTATHPLLPQTLFCFSALFPLKYLAHLFQGWEQRCRQKPFLCQVCGGGKGRRQSG